MLIELLSRIPAYLLRPGPADEDPAARTGLLGELVSGQPAEVEDLAAIGRRCREILEQKYQSIDFTDYRQ
jgi:hypothetical protein